MEGVPRESAMGEKGGTRSGEMRKDPQMENQFQAVFDVPIYSFTIFSAITCAFNARSWSVASIYASPMMVATNRSILNHMLTTDLFRHPR